MSSVDINKALESSDFKAIEDFLNGSLSNTTTHNPKEDEKFIHSIKGKMVYKNLERLIKQGDLDDFEILKLLSSIVTHYIIEYQVNKDSISISQLQPLVITLSTLDPIQANKALLDRFKKYFK